MIRAKPAAEAGRKWNVAFARGTKSWRAGDESVDGRTDVQTCGSVAVAGRKRPAISRPRASPTCNKLD